MNAPGIPARNRAVASAFREAAELLRQQGANPFRAAAFLKGADAVETFPGDIGDVAAQGHQALDAIPHIGRGLAAAIIEMTTSGKWSLVDRLRGSLDAEALFKTIPGVGPALARAMHEGLHAESLEALELAAHDGRLAGLAGIGPRRAEAIRHALSAMLARRRPLATAHPAEAAAAPPVAALLDVDREYREKAAAGELRLIAPKRFNPEGKAWLPVLHTERGAWHFTVLFSNTARAHELAKTADWVVIFYSSADDHQEGQCTVVTETTGPRRGRRVVRGREAETP